MTRMNRSQAAALLNLIFGSDAFVYSMGPSRIVKKVVAPMADRDSCDEHVADASDWSDALNSLASSVEAYVKQQRMLNQAMPPVLRGPVPAYVACEEARAHELAAQLFRRGLLWKSNENLLAQ